MKTTMRKLLFIGVAGMLSVAVNAQDFFIGGSIHAYSDRREASPDDNPAGEWKTNYSGINPKVGIFVTEELAIGAGLDFDRQKDINPDDDDNFQVTNTIAFEPFARYYVISSGDFNVFAEGGLGIGIERSKSESEAGSTDGPKGSMFEIYLMPAISYALTDNFIIEASVGSVYFDRTKSTTENDNGPDQETIDSELGFNFGINSINFGAIFILP